MKAFITLFCLSTLCLSTLNAALPPLYESLNEYKALLNSQELANTLGSAEAIQDIQRTDKGFVITTFRYKIQVDRIYEPQNQPGPAKFYFIFHEREAIK